MTNQHPITPPPEVVDRLFMIEGSVEDRIIAAYRAGADQELEACCEWLDRRLFGRDEIAELRDARRPKAPSLKEQALSELEEIMTELHDVTGSAFTASVIRRALEALDD